MAAITGNGKLRIVIYFCRGSEMENTMHREASDFLAALTISFFLAVILLWAEIIPSIHF